MFFYIIKQELTINLKNLSNLTHCLIFFLITTSIFAITTNIDNKAIAIAIIWICLIFGILLSSGHLFQQDFEDGTLEQLYLSGYIFEIIILAKVIANWLFNVLPLIIILPIIAMILKIPNNLLGHLILIALITSLLISFLVSFGASLTLSANSTSAMITVLILPLLIPTIIFANLGVESDFIASAKILVSLLIFLIPILTFATSLAIKVNITD
jgi:heme exporter protein B